MMVVGKGDCARGFAKGLCERACERMARGLVRDLRDGGIGLARDLRERVFGVHGVIHSRQAIRTAMDINHQTAMRSPFPCRHRRSLQ